MKRLSVWLFAFLSLTLSDVSHALGELKFGPEFSLADLEYDGSSVKFRAVLERMTSHLVVHQPEGGKFTYRKAENEANYYYASADTHFFGSPNGWWFDFFVEGHTNGQTLEVRMSPATVEYFKHFKDDMQDAIFISAANERVFPPMFRGGGHINISDTAFDSGLLFRNFIVDTMINHNELFMGVFGYDTNNALPFWMLPREVQTKVIDLIGRFDRRDLKAKEFVSLLSDTLIQCSDEFAAKWRGLNSLRSKFNAINFSRFLDKNRLEIRAVRPQASMDVWVRQIELFEARLRYLDKIQYRIPIGKKVPVHPLKVEKHLLQPPIDPQLALRSFYQYVTESGLEWKDHTDYLWPKWIADHEVEIFERSRWFIDQESKKDCKSYLVSRAENQ